MIATKITLRINKNLIHSVIFIYIIVTVSLHITYSIIKDLLMRGVINLLVMIYSFLITNIILGVVLCFTSSYSLKQNKPNFYWLHITVLSVSVFELLLSALFILNEQYQQFLFAISTQLLWSCALLYTFFHHVELKKKKCLFTTRIRKAFEFI